MAAQHTWTIGEIACQTGLTVRALRHYEQTGLLSPVRRTAAGRRIYTDADVRALYRIVALRGLGLSLPDIRRAISGEVDAGTLIERQLAVLDSQRAAMEQLRARLVHLRSTVTAGTGDTEDFLEAMELITMQDKYFTAEQREALARRASQLTPAGMADAERDWAELITAAQLEMAAGTPPDDSKVAALARRWKALIEAFTSGDPTIRDSLQRMYENEPIEQASRGTMPDPALLSYMAEAMRALPAG